MSAYDTNIPAAVMPAPEVIASYHELWHVEASFRMSKTDLRARPMFHHTREAIEAHRAESGTPWSVGWRTSRSGGDRRRCW